MIPPLILAAALAATLSAAPLAADVVKATPAGFETRHEVTIAAPPGRVWSVLSQPSRWWSSAHTYSGDAANLSLDLRGGGCWCEKLKDGGAVEHMRVVFFQPGKSLRLIGGLGPLQSEAVQAVLTVTLTPEGANATKAKFEYVVGGTIRAGAEPLSRGVDQVLAAQVAGLKAAAERQSPR